MRLKPLLLLILLALAAFAPHQASAQQTHTRIALIIANEAYAGGAFQALPGTAQDAAVMAPALQRAGFAVTVRRDLDRVQMREALAEFARQLAALGDRGVGFLYYSGHGVGQRGENFLIPIDARVQAVTDLPIAAVQLSDHLEAIEFAGARSVIIVLDACRTTFGRGARGLSPIAARTDTLIAFSTQPNELAADDGLYARVLAAEITRPGADTITAFARVTSAVAAATQRNQVPRYDNGLIEPISFSATEGVATPPPIVAATTPEFAAPTIPTQVVTQATPAPTTARVIFFRPERAAGMLVTFRVRHNGNTIAELRNGRFVTYETTLGEHEFETGSNDSRLDMTLEPGATYYVRQDVVTFSNQAAHLVLADRVSFESLRLRPAD